MCAQPMLRKILACLALLTGLAAAGTPVQAEVTNALATQVQVSASAQPSVGPSAIALRRAPLRRTAPTTAVVPARLSGSYASAPAVRIGSDRARE